MAMTPAMQSRWAEGAEVITVGLPFGAFKLVVGGHLVLAGSGAPGWTLLAVGAVDTALNLVNLTSVLGTGHRWVPTCLAHAALGATHRPHMEELALAVDTMLAFSLVAAMILIGALPALPPLALAVWNVAVVFNVLGAGGLRLARAISELPSAK